MSKPRKQRRWMVKTLYADGTSNVQVVNHAPTDTTLRGFRCASKMGYCIYQIVQFTA